MSDWEEKQWSVVYYTKPESCKPRKIITLGIGRDIPEIVSFILGSRGEAETGKVFVWVSEDRKMYIDRDEIAGFQFILPDVEARPVKRKGIIAKLFGRR